MKLTGEQELQIDTFFTDIYLLSFRIWPTEKLQCVISLGLGRYDASVFTHIKAREKTKLEARPLSLGEKFARSLLLVFQPLFFGFSPPKNICFNFRIVDSATDTELVHETLHDLLPGK